MSYKKFLEYRINQILNAKLQIVNSRNFPYADHINLLNGGSKVDGAVIYADLAQSSALVNDFQRRTAAKIIKCFLFCCSIIIRENRGKITSIDGDRVMGIFIGDDKEEKAVDSAFKINHAVKYLIRSKSITHFTSMDGRSYEFNHGIGIDCGEILAVRGGVQGSNDLIWIGRAPNLAAKLSSIRNYNYNTYVTKDVFNRLSRFSKYNVLDNKLLWDKYDIDWFGDSVLIYCSSNDSSI